MSLQQAPEDEILSDEQIQQLLEQAESRLRTAATDSSSIAPKVPKLPSNRGLQAYIREKNEVAVVDPFKIVSSEEKKLAEEIRTVRPLVDENSSKKSEDAGADWFNLPKAHMTQELKRDLQLLRMRNVLDPGRHYKKNSAKDVPEYVQIGTIIQGPTEYNNRIPKKERKKNFVEEVIAAEKETGRFKKKYTEIQKKKTSGKKAYYKSLREKRRRKGKV
ncbi:hypothetical protein VTN31DRAFT_6870 [Thermomyces dupontii]|uniref:uncharacterized protein n=1 Tax=Talaromyces thermophilus TaxID=28565 RepID=UPI003742787B